MKRALRTRVVNCVGGVISPLLANIYLHYVFDLWVQQWRKRQAKGDVIVVRYCDDFVLGFQHRHEAVRFLTELRERFAKFGLELHPDKTRLIQFGRWAIKHREEQGDGKPETFNFLGFTHISAKTRRGWFTVLRQTMKARFRAKVKEVKRELWRRMHASVPEQAAYLGAVIRGHNRYYGVPLNFHALLSFRKALIRRWWRVLNRRSQTGRVPWRRMCRYVNRWLPRPHIYHPYPLRRLGVIT